MKIIISEVQLKKIIKLVSEQKDSTMNVLFVGDSLSNGPGFTWNYLLEKSYPNWNVDHVVEGGKRTDWMLQNLKSALSEKKYDMVFIWGGTNDMFSQVSVNQAISNIQRMVDLVKQQGGQAYVLEGYDIESVMTDDMLKPTTYCNKDCMLKSRDKMIEFQNKLNSIMGATIIPKVMGDKGWTTDGIHIGGSKHNILKNQISKFLGSSTVVTSGLLQPMEFLDKVEKFLNKTFSMELEKNELTNQLLDNLDKLKNTAKNLQYKGKIIDDKEVIFIQTALELLGHYLPNWGIDGLFGPETSRGVKQLQDKNEMNVTGIVDKETIDKMIQNLKDEDITDEDFERLQIQKTESLKPTDGGIVSTEFSANISGSVIDKFKNILEENDLSYSDFISEVESIGLDPNIAISQLYTESGFNPNVINCNRKSSAGAMGIAQFMPQTWSEYGSGGDPCNVVDSLDAYVKLMKDLLRKFNNRVDLALIGYNWGMNRQLLKSALQSNIPFEEIEGSLPAEPRNYVNKILNMKLDV